MASATTKDMTHGVPWRLIAGFAIPVFLSQLFQQLYNTADSLIVSNFLGDNALAAVSASGPLIFLLISFFAGAASGVGVAIARYFGAGDYDKVSRTVHTAVLLGLISSLILTVIGVLFTPTLLLWMDTDPEVLPDAIGYFRCYFAGVGAGVMYNTFTGIMNALGDSKRPLYFLIVSSVTNVILDLLFVAVLRWGVWSAALATIISQALSAVLCVIHLAKKGTIYQLKLSALRLDGPLLREILRYGLPAGIQNSVIGLANVVVQTNINSFGKMATAAYGAYSKIEGFAFLPVTSFTMAITTYVGQNLGAGMKPVPERAPSSASRRRLSSPSSSVSPPIWRRRGWCGCSPVPRRSLSWACWRHGSSACSTACWHSPTPLPVCAAARARPLCPCPSCWACGACSAFSTSP